MVAEARQPFLKSSSKQADARIERLSADRRTEANRTEVLVVNIAFV